MENILINCGRFASALGLCSETDGFLVGKVSGFPVGLKFVEPTGAMVLLFQIRHWQKADSPQVKSLAYDPEITKLLNEKKLEIEFDDEIAWLTFIDGNACVENQSGVRLLHSVLCTFQKASLIGDPDLCHYCRKVKVEKLRQIENKIVQICPVCLEERVRQSAGTSSAGSAQSIPILLTCPTASFIGAIAWAAVWALHTWVFDILNAKTIVVPQIAVLVVILSIGFVVGGPVGWIIKQHGKRGKTVSVVAAILFSSLGVIVGEIFFLTWLIYHEFKVISISSALHEMPSYYLHNNFIYLVTKAVAAFVCVGVAYTISKPEKPKLRV